VIRGVRGEEPERAHVRGARSKGVAEQGWAASAARTSEALMIIHGQEPPCQLHLLVALMCSLTLPFKLAAHLHTHLPCRSNKDARLW